MASLTSAHPSWYLQCENLQCAMLPVSMVVRMMHGRASAAEAGGEQVQLDGKARPLGVEAAGQRRMWKPQLPA